MKFLSNILVKAGLVVEGTTDLQGTATTITQSSSDSSTKIATTAFVKNQGYAAGNIYTTDGSLSGNRAVSLNGFYLDIAGATTTRFFANGNVVIDGTSPVDAGFKLDVAGTGRYTGVLSANSRLNVNGATDSVNYQLNVTGRIRSSGQMESGSHVYGASGGIFNGVGIGAKTYTGPGYNFDTNNWIVATNGTTQPWAFYITNVQGINSVSSRGSIIRFALTTTAGVEAGITNIQNNSDFAYVQFSGQYTTTSLGVAGETYRVNRIDGQINDASGRLFSWVGHTISPVLSSGLSNATIRGYFYNPTVTVTPANNIAFEATSGIMKLGNLAGTGNRMVIADSSGVLSTQAIASGITGSGSAGQVAFWNGASSQTGSNSFFWDTVNERLGIGLINPQRKLEIFSATADSHLRLTGSAPSVSLGEAITGSVYQAKFGLATASGQYAPAAIAGDFVIISQTGATIWMTGTTERMRLSFAGNLLVGSFSDSTLAKLQVNGAIQQSSVTSSMLKVNSSGVLVAAVGGSDFVAPATLASYVPTSRILTINGVAFDLSADRSWTIAAGVSSFNTRTGAITLTSGDVTGALGYTPYNATNPNGYITGYTETDTLASVTARGATTSTTLTTTVDSSIAAIVAQNNGTGARWYGRIGSFNSSSDKSAFLATYASVAVVGAHNNALTAWANLHVNTVDGVNGGNVYLPTNSYVANNVIIHAGNIGSQSVNYANSAGNADTVDGRHATNAASGLAVYESNGYLYVPSWINVNGGGVFASTNNAHLKPNTGSYGAWEMIGSRNGWAGIYFSDSGDYLMANGQEVGHYTHAVGWKYRWYQGTMYISTGASGGGSEFTVIHSGNIGSQSVNYANSAGSVAWGNVSGKPSNIMYYQSFTLNADTMDSNSTGFTYSVNAPFTGPIARFSTGGAYDMWLGGNYGGSGTEFYLRTRNGDSATLNPWRRIWTNADSTISAGGDFRAPIFYDSQDTSYYLDPNGTSNLLKLSTRTMAYNDMNPMSANSPYAARYNGSAGYRNGTMGYSTTDFNVMFSNWGSGFIDSWSSPANAPGGSSHYVGLQGLHYNYENNTNGYGFQMACAGEADNRFYWRSAWPTLRSWVEMIHSGNIGSQSVSYANTAGNVNNISSAVGGAYTWTGINYFRTNQGGYCGSTDSGKMQAYSDSNNSAFFSWHKGGHFATNMGLDADNVIRIGGWSAAANRWQLDMSGNMTVAGDVTAYSDARVKENVLTVDNALSKVLSLRGVYYNRTDTEDKKRKIGVIAQETMTVIPEVVNQDNDGMYNVSYGNLGGLFIEAFKEQQKRIDAQDRVIEDLKSKLDAVTK